MSSADKKPTYCSIIEGVLRKADDFLTVRQIADAEPELTKDLHPYDRTNRITSNLARLRSHEVVDFVVQNGVTYWCITGKDNRKKHVLEKVRENVGDRGGLPVSIKYTKGRKTKRVKEKQS